MVPGGPGRGPGGADQREHYLRSRLKQVELTPEDWSRARRCLEALQRLALMVDPYWEVKHFGSLANGFAMRGADLDATCFRDSDDYCYLSSTEMQKLMLPKLEADANFYVMEVITGARVPIIKVRFESTLDVDISFQNKEPLPNTNYLHACSNLGPCVRDLVALVKMWAKAAGVCGAVDGHLSTYSFTLMVIYFLQVEPSVGMPRIPTMLFTGESSDPCSVEMRWVCNLSRVHLLHRFFCFYSREFQWGTEVVSVRRGCRARSADPEHALLRGRLEQRLHIEDPFLLERNLHCVLRCTQESILQAKLAVAAEVMQSGLLPEGLGPGEAGYFYSSPPSVSTPSPPRPASSLAAGGKARPKDDIRLGQPKAADGGDAILGAKHHPPEAQAPVEIVSAFTGERLSFKVPQPQHVSQIRSAVARKVGVSPSKVQLVWQPSGSPHLPRLLEDGDPVPKDLASVGFVIVEDPPPEAPPPSELPMPKTLLGKLRCS